MTTIEDKLSKKTTVLEEIELVLFTCFEDTTALEDKKSLTVFSAIAVVGCNLLDILDLLRPAESRVAKKLHRSCL